MAWNRRWIARPPVEFGDPSAHKSSVGLARSPLFAAQHLAFDYFLLFYNVSQSMCVRRAVSQHALINNSGKGSINCRSRIAWREVSEKFTKILSRSQNRHVVATEWRWKSYFHNFMAKDESGVTRYAILLDLRDRGFSVNLLHGTFRRHHPIFRSISAF